MCTAITYKTRDHYFGRNLDLEGSFNETVTVTPRNFPFYFRKMKKIEGHFAIIGMAYVCDGYPLYYDATNEKGLSAAGLNFPGNASYKPFCEGKDNVAPFELIPWLLSQCASVSDAENLISKINLLNENFNAELPLSPLHWIISDSERSIIIEPLKSGVKVYQNPVGVLTNNPTFDYHLFNLNNFMSLSSGEPTSTFAGDGVTLEFNKYSRGLGALGLPGDCSSASRFIKASFVKLNSISGEGEQESVSQFFHILKSVEMQKGCVRLESGLYDITIYSSCCNTTRGIYYYTTYNNSGISAVDIHRENLEGKELICYPLNLQPTIFYHN